MENNGDLEVLVFYNTSNGDILGYYHPTSIIVSTISDAFVYRLRSTDIITLLNILKGEYQIGKVIINLQKKYFNNIDYNLINAEYIKYSIATRQSKVNNLIKKINEL